jgi:hypothetical protein
MRATMMSAAFLVSILIVSACSDDDDAGARTSAGPIDGAWNVTTFSCDGQVQPIPKLTVTISNTSGTFVIEIPQACTATIAEEYSYPKAGTIRIAPKSNQCSPSGAACAPAFGGVDSCPTPAAVDFDYVLAGSELTFKRTSVGPPVDTCPAGTAAEYRMTK